MTIYGGYVEGLEELEKLEADVATTDLQAIIWMEALSVAVRQAVTNKLQTLLGDKMSHFEVVIIPSPEAFIVSVRPVDEVGVYLYEGTQPHIIMGDNMPIGGDIYAQEVRHPGTKGYKEEINVILQEAMALAMVGALE